MSGSAVPEDLRPPAPEENTIPPADDPAGPAGVQEPPRTIGGTLRKLGPGLIIAGSIVGSGELIATTKTGAQAGIVLLWLILLGCVIKVFVQIELGRTCITHGITTLAALNKFPGRIGPVNWILWFWVLMMAASIAQLGGIVGGVGQALALAIPLTGDYARAIQMPSATEVSQYLQHDELLSEWDLRVRDISQTDRSADAGSGVNTLTETGREWLATRVSAVEAGLARLPAGVQNELEAAYRGTFDGSTPRTARERNASREALNRLLDELNARSSTLPAEPGAVSGDLRLQEEDRRRQRRLHARLAAQLSEASRARPAAEVIEAVSIVAVRERTRSSIASGPVPNDRSAAAKELRALDARVKQIYEPATRDDKTWATVVTLATILLLANGKYGVVEWSSTIMVVMFTFVTIGNSISLQFTQDWALSAADLWRGLSLGIPASQEGLTMALATFGIIGVGATELVTYPYWCIEKGYARFTGRWSSDAAWAERARGWMRVMQWDALCSMVIYTVATVAFFLVGAAVLNREGRDPDGMRMVGTLAAAYEPVFGEYAKYLFLIGAVAVLYSTFLVANAGHSRLFTDALKVFRLMSPNNQQAHNRAVTVFCIVLPLISLAIFLGGVNPVQAVAFAGMMQATMLPMIGVAALYWRYHGTDPRLAPPRWWDVLLVVSFLGLLIVGTYGFYEKITAWTGWRF